MNREIEEMMEEVNRRKHEKGFFDEEIALMMNFIENNPGHYTSKIIKSALEKENKKEK